MTRARTEQPILPSLLDRLIDDDPSVHLEAVKSPSTALREIKSNIRRDLENLLNTRIVRYREWGAMSELRRSVLNYGLPDFSHLQLSLAGDRDEFRALVESTILIYEPRFRQVQVEVADTGSPLERTLYLKISALLMLEPEPVSVLFDSRIRALDRPLKLRELQRG